MVYLPWEILSDILVRLPLKSIARFRCVDRLWRDELKGAKFLRAHRRFASEMGKFNLMLRRRNDIYTFSVDASLSICDECSHIKFPPEPPNKRIEVFGCCHGLVLLGNFVTFRKYFLMLWNPTTKECKTLPNLLPGAKAKGRGYGEYALGYSAVIEDFKVVYITQALQDGFCEVQVYTLKSNSWRRIDNVEVDYLDCHGMSDTLRWPVSGAAHWLADVDANSERNSILTFEFETEAFDATILPDFNTDLEPVLCYLGGSLCFFGEECEDTNVITVWELKNNGVEKLWTKLFIYETINHFGSAVDFIPLKSLSNGKILLGIKPSYKDLHIVLYDPKHDTVETLNVYESTVHVTSISVYEETLHSLDTGTYLT